ncbi:MAG: multicopper oxidase domain-containing protein [Alphaproteobacteria bacterium]
MISRRAALTGLMLGGAGLATAGVLSGRDARRWLFGPAAFAASPKPLAIPQVIAGEVRDGVRTYALGLQKGVSQFFTGVETPTLGINGAYLGPTLKMRAGELVRMNVTNRIGEPSTIHWHGFHLPARADGGPHQVIRDGETWSPQFVVKQRAAMFWYHSHMVPRTGPQVYHGLAGLIYVDDDETARLDLPSDYGVDDIPLVLQDRAFGNDGSLLYSTSMPSVMMGVRGNVLLVNGTVRPYFEARTSKLRLRILNGSNARSHTVGFADGRTFQQIGTDGGLLERPFETSRITLAPAERTQIIVDLDDGRPALLRTLAAPNTGMMGGGGMMGGMMERMMGDDLSFDVLDIRPGAQRSKSARLPDRLVNLGRPDPYRAVGTRRFVLQMGMGGMMMGGGSFTINGKAMDMNRIDEAVRVGTSEIWQIENASMMSHPFHIHDVQFRVLDRNGAPPAPGEMGLKDTVVVAPSERVRLLLSFTDYSDPDSPYMYHCHILEHEDAGMMGQFVVKA